MNTNPGLRANPITESVNQLALYIDYKERHNFRSDDEEDSDDEIRPFKGFAKPLSNYKYIDNKNIWSEKTNRLLQLIGEHVEEALQNGFDDSIAKYKGKSHFVVRAFFFCLIKRTVWKMRVKTILVSCFINFYRYHLANHGMRCLSCCIKYLLKIQII